MKLLAALPFGLLCATGLLAAPGDFRIGQTVYPADCAELKPAPLLTGEDERRNGYAELAELTRAFTASAAQAKTQKAPGTFQELGLLGGRYGEAKAPSAIVMSKVIVLLRRDAEGLAAWDRLMSAPLYREPAMPDSFKAVYAPDATWAPHFSAVREAVLANLWRIRLALHQGRDDEAWRDWLTLRAGVHRLAENSNLLISTLIASVLERRVNAVAWELRPPVSASHDFPVEGETFDPARWRSVWLAETRFGLVAVPETDADIRKFISMHWPIWTVTKPRPTTVAEYREKVVPLLGPSVQRARESLAKLKRLGAPGLENPVEYRARMQVDDDSAKRDRALVEVGFEGLFNLDEITYVGQRNFRLTRAMDRVAIALRAYACEHGGAYPASLAALSPRYITTLPTDPYSGLSLRYDPLRPALWSVGADGHDDGGTGLNPPLRFSPEEPADVVSRPDFRR